MKMYTIVSLCTLFTVKLYVLYRKSRRENVPSAVCIHRYYLLLLLISSFFTAVLPSKISVSSLQHCIWKYNHLLPATVTYLRTCDIHMGVWTTASHYMKLDQSLSRVHVMMWQSLFMCLLFFVPVCLSVRILILWVYWLSRAKRIRKAQYRPKNWTMFTARPSAVLATAFRLPSHSGALSRRKNIRSRGFQHLHPSTVGGQKCVIMYRNECQQAEQDSFLYVTIWIWVICSFYRAAWNADAVLRWEFCPSVCLSVRLSVRCVNCAKTAERYVYIFIRYER